ncbi:TraB family protein [uncultured archaeon]|nr:TraB family protein [uncultured archaeon]
MPYIKIVGTSHISPESLKKVEETILDNKPQIVAIELDAKRLYALIHKGKERISYRDIRKVGLKGWLFAIIGAWAEKKLGAKVGVAPGSEMLKAVAAAQQVGARVALIDQDINITLKRFSKSLTWKEKFTFAVDLFKGVVLKKGVQFDLEKVPSQKVINTLIEDVKKRYPSVYRVLVEERNEYMAKRLAILKKVQPEANIVAVVGAGHEREIRTLLKKYLKPEENK